MLGRSWKIQFVLGFSEALLMRFGFVRISLGAFSEALFDARLLVHSNFSTRRAHVRSCQDLAYLSKRFDCCHTSKLCCLFSGQPLIDLGMSLFTKRFLQQQQVTLVLRVSLVAVTGLHEPARTNLLMNKTCKCISTLQAHSKTASRERASMALTRCGACFEGALSQRCCANSQTVDLRYGFTVAL